MNLNDKFSPLFNSDVSVRYFIVTGGRGSGKSFAVGTHLTTSSLIENYKTLFCRFTLKSAAISIIPEFIEKIEILKYLDTFKINLTDILNKVSGASILFRGIKTSSGNQTANLKSIQNVACFVLDEAEELTEEDVFDEIDLSIRSKTHKNRIILIMNPSTKEHWVYQRFFESMGVEEGFNGIADNVCYIHTDYRDNIGNLSQSFLDRIEQIRLTNPKKYLHRILGQWLKKAEGVVFEDWEYGEFNPDKLQTSCGMDFGFSVDPDTLTEVAIDKAKKIIYLKEHIYQSGLKIAKLAELILKAVGDKFIVSEVDPRLVAELQDRGVNVEQHIKGKIETGILIMQDYKFIVDPDSTNIGKELNNHVYSDKKSNLYVDSYNHGIDGSRYNIEHHLRDPGKGEYHLEM